MTTTTIPPEVEKFADFVRAMKEKLVAEASDGSDDLPTFVEARVGETTVAIIISPEVNRDQGLVAARIAADAYGADDVWFVADAHMNLTPDGINPATGELWGPGEMAAACEGANACQLGLITDCMMVNRARRDGFTSLLTLPYHLHHGEGSMRWTDDIRYQEFEPENQPTGIIPETMRACFEHPANPAKRPLAEVYLSLNGYTVWS